MTDGIITIAWIAAVLLTPTFLYIGAVKLKNKVEKVQEETLLQQKADEFLREYMRAKYGSEYAEYREVKMKEEVQKMGKHYQEWREFQGKYPQLRDKVAFEMFRKYGKNFLDKMPTQDELFKKFLRWRGHNV